jgi:multidrug efflux pump subunit AcrA (membrane-fusion protein)
MKMKVRRIFGRVRPRTWLIAGIAVIVVAGGSVYWFGFGPTSTTQSAQAAETTVAASLQTLQQTVSGTGTLAPTSSEDVNFAASGTVTSVKVVAGSTVKAGQVLATIDTLTEKANLLTVKATLASAEAQLASAESSSTGTTSELAQIAADKASVSVAAAAVTSAKTEYAGTTLVAPIAGLVTTVGLSVGDVVSGGSTSSSSTGGASASTGSSSTATSGTGSTSTSTSTSTSDFTIVGTNSWDISVSLGASDIKNIKAGQQVTLSTDENSSFFGTVASIGLLPSTTSGAATYPVVVDVTGSPTDLYDGVTVTAKIIYEKRTNVLTVPSAAVTTANGASSVEVVKSGKTTKTTVTVGETVGNLTEITKGISTGAEVQVTLFTPGTGNTGTTRTGGTGTRGTFGGTGTGGTGNFTPPTGGFGGGTGATGDTNNG